MSAVLSTIQSEACALLRRVLGLNRAGAIAGTLVALFLARTLRAWYRLSHVPGPFWGGFSKYWMVKQSLRGRQPYAIRDVIEEYGQSLLSNLLFSSSSWRGALPDPRWRNGLLTVIGSLARIGPNELVTDDPELLRRMMAVRSDYSRGSCTSWTIPFPAVMST